MSVWREIISSKARDIASCDFSKLNVVQQEVADLFMSRRLTKVEVFLILNGLIDKRMVDKISAEKYLRENYGNIVEAEFGNPDGFYNYYFNKQESVNNE